MRSGRWPRSASPSTSSILAVSNALLEEQLRLAAEAGAGSAVIFASGYEEPREGVPPLTERLATIARGAGMAVCGGNCMGFANLERRVRALGFYEPKDAPVGGVTFLSHSGSAFSAMIHNDRALGLNLAVSAGQEFVTTVADYLTVRARAREHEGRRAVHRDRARSGRVPRGAGARERTRRPGRRAEGRPRGTHARARRGALGRARGRGRRVRGVVRRVRGLARREPRRDGGHARAVRGRPAGRTGRAGERPRLGRGAGADGRRGRPGRGPVRRDLGRDLGADGGAARSRAAAGQPARLLGDGQGRARDRHRVRPRAARGSGGRRARVRGRPDLGGVPGHGLHRDGARDLPRDRQAVRDALELLERHRPGRREAARRRRDPGARGDAHGSRGVQAPVRVPGRPRASAGRRWRRR